MTQQTSVNFSEGDNVNVKRSGRWTKDVWTISKTWWTTEDGRLVQIKESQEIFSVNNVRHAQ